MKLKSLLLACIICLDASAALNDYVGTQQKNLGRVYVSFGVYYFESQDQNWGATGCPNARYAYIAEGDAGAKAIFAAALTAKASGMLVSFAGHCGDTNGNDTFLRVKDIYLP